MPHKTTPFCALCRPDIIHQHSSIACQFSIQHCMKHDRLNSDGWSYWELVVLGAGECVHSAGTKQRTFKGQLYGTQGPKRIKSQQKHQWCIERSCNSSSACPILNRADLELLKCWHCTVVGTHPAKQVYRVTRSWYAEISIDARKVKHAFGTLSEPRHSSTLLVPSPSKPSFVQQTLRTCPKL
eukprot:5072195-Amphidinium_carterae.1